MRFAPASRNHRLPSGSTSGESVRLLRSVGRNSNLAWMLPSSAMVALEIWSPYSSAIHAVPAESIVMSAGDSGRPNSFGGPKADPSAELPTWQVEAGEMGRYAYHKHRDDDDFVQPRALYRDVMNDTDREHLVTNIVAHASDGVSDDMQRRVIGYWTNVDTDLGARVAAGLGARDGSGDGAAAPTDATSRAGAKR